MDTSSDVPNSLAPHHMHPQSRPHPLLNLNDERNKFRGWRTDQEKNKGKHKAWNVLTGSKTPEEAIIFLIQKDLGGETLTNTLLIALYIRLTEKISNQEAIVRARLLSFLSIPAPKQTVGSRRRHYHLEHKSHRKEAWKKLFGSMSGQKAILWIIGNLFPEPSYYEQIIRSPIVRALYYQEQKGLDTEEAIKQSFSFYHAKLKGKNNRKPSKKAKSLHHYKRPSPRQWL